MRLPRVTFSSLAAAVAVAVVGAALPAPASAATSGLDYVALGDSYSSGLGAGFYSSDSGACLRSPYAFPQLWANRQQATSFVFAACAGATTSGVTSGQLSGLSANTDLVTISIGGNDAGFGNVVVTCRLGSEVDCGNAVDTSTAFVRFTLPALLDATYSAIRTRAPHARVVVLGYPRLFELTFCGLGSIGQTRREILNSGVDVMAATIASRAQAAGFTYADVRAPFAGHGVCGADPWIHGTILPVEESYHPSAAGHSNAYLAVLNSVTG